MRLLSSPTSPYARKVRMTVLEKGLADRVAIEPGVPMGTADEAAAVRRVNPLGKIPALVLDTGEALYDSPVICEYLDAIGTGPALLPASGTGRWTALRLQALGDGVADGPGRSTVPPTPWKRRWRPDRWRPIWGPSPSPPRSAMWISACRRSTGVPAGPG